MEHTYPFVLRSKLQSELGPHINVSIANLGVNGAKVQRPIAGTRSQRPSFWSSPHFEALKAASWDLVLLLFGTNDVRADALLPVGDRLSSRAARACSNISYVRQLLALNTLRLPRSPHAIQAAPCVRFVRDYGALIDQIRRSQQPPPQTFLIVPPHAVFDWACDVDTPALTGLVPSLLRLVAELSGLPPPIDIQPALLKEEQEQRPNACSRIAREPAQHCELYSCDRLHLSDRGYNALALAVLRSVKHWAHQHFGSAQVAHR